MIAHAKRLRAQTLQDRFLELLPQIRTQASLAFRDEKHELREELIAEVIANCFVAFVRLMDRGLADVIYPTPLTNFAIKQVRSGRKVGGRLNVNDVSSGYAQKAKGFVLEELDRFDQQNEGWKEILIEDRHAGPAETAASRIDVGEWLRSLPRGIRKVAETLALGETTKKAARKHGVSPGRISQMRRELMGNWQAFQCELAPV
ncbi:MAG: hypothetical protein H8E44_29470 [Planctomycetes bacterium]|nr:hypothetical protein [Planctomycetota bacterium]MBL7044162.1 hypothetical protein [Pirellulaceae bacterium]